MRQCRKCNARIPNWMWIEGKRKNLHSRKFCLQCSPYRGHNTKPDDPLRINGRKGKYSGWSSIAKNKNKENIYRRGQRRKKELVAISGGKCCKCGYNKSIKALTFHHRNPEEKVFPLCINNLWSKAWDKIILEHSKCDLLCMNCHAEIEDEIKRLDPLYYKNQFNID